MRESSISILGWVLAWCVSGVSNMTKDFGAEIRKDCPSGTQLFPLGSCLGSHLGMMTPETHTVRSSAWQTRLTGSVGLGMSAM